MAYAIYKHCIIARDRCYYHSSFRKVKVFSHLLMSDSVTLWTIAHQAPLSMEFSRQEYWSGLPFPSPGNLPNPGCLHFRRNLYGLSHQGSPMKRKIELKAEVGPGPLTSQLLIGSMLSPAFCCFSRCTECI